MAFFCPVFPGARNARARGRSDNVESCRLFGAKSLSALDLDGDDCTPLKPHSVAVVTNGFQPTVDDEVGVDEGETVSALYREQDWIYIVKSDGSEGFIPAIYCQLRSTDQDSLGRQSSESDRPKQKMKWKKHMLGGSLIRRDKGKRTSLKNSGSMHNLATTTEREKPKSVASAQSPKAAENVHRFLASLTGTEKENPEVAMTGNESKERVAVDCSQPECRIETVAFRREPQGCLVVLFDFVARAEDDVTVRRGELVTLLNRDDPDWCWVLEQRTGFQGFVPSSYLAPVKASNLDRGRGGGDGVACDGGFGAFSGG